MASPTPQNPTPAALALLNQSGTPDVKTYLQGFISQNLPHLNVAIVAQGNDVKTEMQQAIAQALERRPELRQRLAGDSGLQQSVDSYIDTASRTANATREDRGFNKPEGNDTGPAGTYHFGTNAPSSLRKEGLDVMVVSLDGHSACRGCKRQHEGPVACNDAVSPAQAAEMGIERLAGQSVFRDGVKPVLASVSTAFHELAHGMDLHGRSMMGINFEAMFGNKDFSSKAESTADVFAALMLIREFGEVGRIHAQGKLDPTDLPQTAGHYTINAVRDALKWASENPEALKKMSVQELFDHSRKIGHNAALTQDQAVDFGNYIESVYDPDKKPLFKTDVIDQFRAGMESAPPFRRATDNAHTRIELGRLSEANMLSCPVKPEAEEAASAAADPAKPLQRSKPGAAPGSVS